MLPFRYRLGKEYTRFSGLVKETEPASGEQREKYALEKFKAIFDYARAELPFYQRFYQEREVMDLKIESLEDVKKVPTLTKSDIRDYADEFKGRYKINTGGTSGEPFSFWIDRAAWAREWAHMHYVWELKGYSYRDLKVTMRGKNLGEKLYVYNPIHNEFVINTYLSPELLKVAVLEIFSKYPVKYIHGYPSAIYAVFSGIEKLLTRSQKASISAVVRACFLGSEYPHPQFVDYLKHVWGFDYISWYGHSEMCILAYDAESKNEYRPFLTYGYTEVEDGHLIGTSYHNDAMPLIRYDTGDIVSAKYDSNGLVNTFSIEQGRVGDFVTDRHGVQIPLTALLFGRHHKVFDIADYVQVGQESSDGPVTFYVTAKTIGVREVNELFDLTNVNQDFNIKVLTAPILTKSGKYTLKISSADFK